MSSQEMIDYTHKSGIQIRVPVALEKAYSERASDMDKLLSGIGVEQVAENNHVLFMPTVNHLQLIDHVRSGEPIMAGMSVNAMAASVVRQVETIIERLCYFSVGGLGRHGDGCRLADMKRVIASHSKGLDKPLLTAEWFHIAYRGFLTNPVVDVGMTITLNSKAADIALGNQGINHVVTLLWQPKQPAQVYLHKLH